MTSVEKRTEIFENMPVRRAVFAQIIPAIASQMIALIYSLADTYFVGMLNDPNQTAAVTVVSMSFAMLTAISNLFGIGGASMVARSLGKKQPEKARQISAISFWGGVLSALTLSTVLFLLANPILHLCGATADTYDYAYKYAMWVIVIGGPPTILNTLLANLVRSEGSAKTASFGVSMGGIINIILDPIFVLPQFLGLGVAGAGMATALSNLLSASYLLSYILLHRKTTVLSINPKYLAYASEHLANILSIGLPSAIQFALTAVSVAALMNFTSKYCTEAVAGLGIVRKLDNIPLYFSTGLANGLLPLLAYNHSAGNHKRRKQAFQFGCMISLGFSLLCVVCFELFAPQLVGLFIEDNLTRQYGAVFLRIMVVAMPLMSLCYPMIIQFQGMGRVKESLVCSILRKGVLDIPLLFLLDHTLPLYGCMMVQPIVDAVSLVFAFIFYRRINRELNLNT